MTLTESIIEDAALTWFGERNPSGDVLLMVRPRETVRRLDPTIPKGARARIADVQHLEPNQGRTHER